MTTTQPTPQPAGDAAPSDVAIAQSFKEQLAGKFVHTTINGLNELVMRRAREIDEERQTRAVHAILDETARAIQAGKGWRPASELPPCKQGGIASERVLVRRGNQLFIDVAYYDWKPTEKDYMQSQFGDFKPRFYCGVEQWIPVDEAIAALAGVGFDMLAHLQRQREWSERTFGPGPRTQGVIDHIRKELLEVLADPADFSEWIDVIILALDGAWRAGASPQEIISGIVAKQTKNEGRIWPDWRTADPNKAIEHDRSGERVQCDAWSCNGGTVCGPYDNDMICGKCNGTGFKATTPDPAAPDGDELAELIAAVEQYLTTRIPSYERISKALKAWKSANG